MLRFLFCYALFCFFTGEGGKFENVTDSPEFCLSHSKWKKEIRSPISNLKGTALTASKGASFLT